MLTLSCGHGEWRHSVGVRKNGRAGSALGCSEVKATDPYRTYRVGGVTTEDILGAGLFHCSKGVGTDTLS